MTKSSLVPATRLELASLSAHAPKACVSTNFTTRAHSYYNTFCQEMHQLPKITHSNSPNPQHPTPQVSTPQQTKSPRPIGQGSFFHKLHIGVRWIIPAAVPASSPRSADNRISLQRSPSVRPALPAPTPGLLRRLAVRLLQRRPPLSRCHTHL